MKRFFKAIAALAVAYPKSAIAGSMLLLGAGGAVGIALFTTPTITPQTSTYFNQNQVGGNTNNVLKPNGGVAGAFSPPSTATNSMLMYFELGVSPTLAYSQSEEDPLSPLILIANTVPGQPAFWYQKTVSGILGTQWLVSPSPSDIGSIAVVAGTNYNTGFFPFTATGGGCAREPTGVWYTAGPAQIVDHGFMCPTTPTATALSAPNSGAQQTATSATCASGGAGILVTTSVPISPGLSPGQLYTVNLTGTGGTSLNPATLTATSVTGSGPYSVVGTIAGSCPTGLAGTILSGTGATLTMPAAVVTAPFQFGNTGITTNNNQRICGFLGEDGDDSASPFPGAQFISMVNEKGNSLPGSPALVPWLNQGTANFTGYTLAGTQATGPTPALNVTTMNSYTITAASFTAGHATFTTSAAPGFIAGSEFTVSGMTPTAWNGTYVAVGGTTQASTSITGNLLTGPAGTPTPQSTPATATGFGSMVSVILPGMTILGANGPGVVSPYGTFGSSGTGGTGSYGLITNQAGFTFTGSIASTTLTLTSTPNPVLVPGQALTSSTGSGFSATKIVKLLTGTGTSGSTYQVDVSQTAAAGTISAAGAIGTSGSPASIFAYSSPYYTAVPNSSATGTVTRLTSGQIGDFFGFIGGSGASSITNGGKGWGGRIANVSMLYGNASQAGGSPNTSDLASLCTKTTDIQAYAAANGLTVHSLYRLNDLGIFGDSGNATITGYITNPGGSAATLNVVSTTYGSLALATGTETAKLTGVGLPVASPATIGLSVTAGSVYSITPNTTATLGSIGAPVNLAVGSFSTAQPLVPTAPQTFKGYIDTASSISTLHVTSLDSASHTGFAGFTGTLTTQFTGSLATSGVYTVASTSPVNTLSLGVGTIINSDVAAATPFGPCTVTSLGTGLGLTGTYQTNCTGSTIPASGTELAVGSGILPAGPTHLATTSIVGGETIAIGMLVTDGNASLTGPPLLITNGGSQASLTVAPNYYPAIAGDTTMVGSTTRLVPGEYIFQAGLNNIPVKIVGGTGNGGAPGDYTLSANVGTVGSSGSPVTFTGTTAQDGGAIAPGPALTIADLGPGITYPFNHSTSTGPIEVSGTYDTAALGGVPATIQAQVSLSSGGPAVLGCTPCAWTNLTSYSTSPFTFTGSITTGGAMTVAPGTPQPSVGNAFTGAGYSGTVTATTGLGTFTVSPSPGSPVASETMTASTVFNWSGSAAGIPPGGPYYVSVRASNGTAYASLSNYVKVGDIYVGWGQGQAGEFVAGNGGGNTSNSTSLLGLNRLRSVFVVNSTVLTGPPVISNYQLGQAIPYAGDSFGVSGGGLQFSEGVISFEQPLATALGYPITVSDMGRDGVGVMPTVLGSVAQTQTVAVADGSKTAWCSAASFCANVGSGGTLTFNAASLTGAIFQGSATSGVLTVGTFTSGALEPGMSLSYSGSPGGLTLVNCLTNCTGINGATSTWALSSSVTASSQSMHADPASGPAPWPTFNVQVDFSVAWSFGGFGAAVVKPTTFTITDTDPSTGIATQVCHDTQTSVYVTGGNCTGAGISSGFVNYLTGGYQVTFSVAPTSGHVITASWINNVATNAVTNQFGRFPTYDYFGDGTSQSGPISALMAKTPGGVSGHIFTDLGTDLSFLLNSGAAVNPGYEFGAVGYTQAVSYLFSTKYPALIPNSNPSVAFISPGAWHNEGPSNMVSFINADFNLQDQWDTDVATKSTFSGTINSGTSVLTLTTNATGQMWEGEVLGCAPFSLNPPFGTCLLTNAGVYITGLHAGSPQGWGVSGSTYDLAGSVPNIASAIPMHNAIYYTGPGPVIYAGALNDITNQQQTGIAGTLGSSPHILNGMTGYRRATTRWAASLYEADTTGNDGGSPTLSRANDSAGGTPSPAFDYGNTYAASATGTVATVGGVSVVTFNSGISAHARPFVDGQWVTCASCTPQVITSISVPPTHSTATGAGEVGQSFTVTLGGSLGLTGSKAITAGCHSVSGSGGSNCVNVDFTINVTGTYGIAASLDNCGVNNINGNSPNYVVASGSCPGGGLGEFVEGFRFSPFQLTNGNSASLMATGSGLSDGIDIAGGAFNQSNAHTCNIVAATVVQCVKGPVYSSGLFSSVGLWTSGATFVNFGSGNIVSGGRIASVLGYAGGQSFPIASAGSGQTPGLYAHMAGTGCSVTSGGTTPTMDIWVGAGGTIIDAYPANAAAAMGIGVAGACSFAPTGAGGTAGSIGPLTIAPVEGAGGIATYGTDQNTASTMLYDNSFRTGNPLNAIGTNAAGEAFEPGVPVRPFGQFQGVAVSG